MCFSSTVTPVQRHDFRAGRDHDVLGGDFLAVDNDGGAVLEAGGARDPIDLVFLEQEGDAIGIGLHHPILERHHLVELQPDLANV